MDNGVQTSELLGRAVIAIRGDMSKLPGDLTKAGDFLREKFSAAGMLSGLTDLGASMLAAYEPVKLVEAAISNFKTDLAEAAHEGSTLRESLRRLNAVIETTGNTTGFTAKQHQKYADALQDEFAVGSTEIMEFQARLAQFKNVNGEVFQRATKVALDWSAVMGETMPSKARILGMALNDPIRGVHMLRRAQVQLTSDQEKLLKHFVQTGQAAKAQDMILKALEERYAGGGEKMLTATKKLKSELSSALEDMDAVASKMEPIKITVRIIRVKYETGLLDSVKDFFGDFFGGLFNDFDSKTIGKMARLAGRYSGITGIEGIMNPGMPGLPTLWGEFAKARALWETIFPKKDAADNEKAPPTKIDLDKHLTAKDVTGIFDPLALSRKIQDSVLDKNDQIISQLESGNAILGEIRDRMDEGDALEGHQ